jgi:branched-chain amino acid transport system permease protein
MTTTADRRRTRIKDRWGSDRSKIILWSVFAAIVASAYFAMEPNDWLLTMLRGLSVGAITFLVASGLSLIFGLMDVLNLAHGELFMLGAYMGWTIYVRPDTALDLVTVLLVAGAGLAMMPAWPHLIPLPNTTRARRLGGGGALIVGLVGLGWVVPKFPLSIWSSQGFADTPIADSVAFDQGLQRLPDHAAFDGVSVAVGFVVLVLAASLISLAIAIMSGIAKRETTTSTVKRRLQVVGGLGLAGIVSYLVNDPLTEWFYTLGTTPRFFIALAGATVLGFVIGGAVEALLIRPLYGNPLYQLMITLGLGFILIELVRFGWGRPEFTMPKPAIFNGRGQGCPAEGVGGLFSGCSTTELFGARVRTYNEMFVILVGIVVLVSVTLLIKKTRLGMMIRAGVEDQEMVQALGVNVRKVFNFTFALGVGLASLGGVVAAPSIGLSTGMGSLFLLLALIAMAVGGLTSFPGAAVGAVLVGVFQQLVIKFGQVGIPIPGLEEPFKPSPALVPASVILVMVVVLLVLPGGLMGRSDT